MRHTRSPYVEDFEPGDLLVPFMSYRGMVAMVVSSVKHGTLMMRNVLVLDGLGVIARLHQETNVRFERVAEGSEQQ